MTRQIFSGVKYSISTSLPTQRREELTKLLDANGASLVDVGEAGYVISDTLQFEGRERAQVDVKVVTDSWVERSLLNGRLLDTSIFSADPLMIFSGTIICVAELEPCDREVIAAGVNALGGLYRDGYTRDCTHVIAARPGSDKYKTAMHYKAVTQVHIVLPHWFDDCFKLLVRLPETNYAWPDPPLLRPDLSLSKSQLPPLTKAFVKTAVLEDEPEPMRIAALNRSHKDIWGGKFILLSPSLKLGEGRREAVEASVRRAGGVIVNNSGDEALDVAQADVYIIQHRVGLPFAKAVRMHKTIGTLSWLFNVHKLGVVSRPEDQLVHFPTNTGVIKGFEKHKITATNYEGDARRYLKKLIELMGGEFTPQMTTANTVVVAAFLGGEKANKARDWDIPVVNHTWLEDCFISWSARNPAQEKYINFPPGLNFGTLVGTRGIVPITEEELIEIEREASLPKQVESITAPSDGASAANELSDLEDTTRTQQNGSPRKVSSKEIPKSPTKSTAGDQGDMKHHDEGFKGSGSSPLKKGNAHKGLVHDKSPDSPDGHRSPDKMGSPSNSYVDESYVDEVRDRTRTPAKALRGRQRKTITPAKRTARDASLSDDDDEKENRVDTLWKSKSVNKMDDVNEENKVPRGRTAHVSKKAVTTRSKSRTSATKEARVPQRRSSRSRGRSISTPRESERKNASPAKAKNHISQIDLLYDNISSSDEITTPIKHAPKRKPNHIISDDDQSEHESSNDKGPLLKNKPKGGRGQVAAASPPKELSTPKRRLERRPSLPGPKSGQVVVEIQSPRKNSSQAYSISNEPSLAKGSVNTPKRKKPTGEKSITQDDLSDESPLSSPRTPGKVLSKQKSKPNRDSVHPSSRPMPLVNSVAQQRTPSRRQAATKAATRLHESATDMNQYEKERRSGTIRGPWEEKAAKSKAKEGNELDKKKRRISAVDADAAETESKGKRLRKAQSNAKLDKGKGAAQDGLSDDENEESGGPRDSNSIEAIDISLMTTQVTLSDSILKGLRQLGVKIASKPTECNLLVANTIGRTEKFLCAMATVRNIVTEKWAHDSVKAKRLLPPEDYLLRDPEGEKKYSFKLLDALRRSQSSSQRLLEGHTFYFTKSLQKNDKFSTYKNVITSAGGKVLVQNPTARILRGHKERHVVSLEEDSKITEDLIEEGYHIYVPEFILVGVLTQKMDWDTTPHRLDNN